MTQLRENRKRIRSIDNTKKVTHAMELVAAAKMRKSQESALSARPYSTSLHHILYQIQNQSDVKHALLKTNKAMEGFIILISSDRGLAGGLNINLFKEILKIELKNTLFITVGKKAFQFAAKTGKGIFASFGSEEVPIIELARRLSKIAIDNFRAKKVSKVTIFYPHFESTMKQVPKWIQLLPIKPVPEEEVTPQNQTGEILFEPSIPKVVDVILPHHVLTEIYQILLEAKASEHSARMVAMKNATDAAGDLIDDLTLTYNQARQETITKELLDITTAQRAFE